MLTITAEAADTMQVAEVTDLYAAVGWSAYTRDERSLMRALAGSHRIVTARDAGRLVGLARSISDGETIVYIQDVLVRPEVQRLGIGRRLIATLLQTYEGIRQQVLLTDTEVRQRKFYEALGFTEAHEMRPELRAFVRLR